MTSIIDIAAILISVSALFAYINLRFIGLPTTIGVMIVAMLASVLVYMLSLFGLGDFHKWIILSLATVGVCISTFLVGTATYYLLEILSCHLPYIYCLLFGALISPTDPIAVMATVKRLGVSKELETTIAGESLFNDGVGVVVFMVLLMLLQTPDQIDAVHIAVLFAEEALGGIVFGLVLGALGYYLLNTIDNYKVEVLITLALVMGGYGLALYLHTSGPIAVVVAGLITGSVLRKHAMSDRTRRSVDVFWELIDEILNVILFALIGLEMLIIPFEGQWFIAGLSLIVVVVLGVVCGAAFQLRLRSAYQLASSVT